MDKTIYLVGARASGKTTIGRLLAEELQYTFVDTDVYLLESTKKTVAEIVDEESWDGFRKRESQALKECTEKGRVIATGGGMILSEKNRQYMKENGIVFYLSAEASVLSARLMKDPNVAQRPSLTGASITDEMEQILKERQSLYQDSANYIIDVNQSVDKVVSKILNFLKDTK